MTMTQSTLLVMATETELLWPHAMQNIKTGTSLYQLYATKTQINQANDNLAKTFTTFRYILISGEPIPLRPTEL